MDAATLPAGAVATLCRSCRAPVWWAATEAGEFMPVDADPAPDGNVETTGALTATPQGSLRPVVKVRAAGEATLPLAGVDEPVRWRSHFASCPQADEWRRR